MSAPRLSDVLWSSMLALLLSLPASAQSPQHSLTILVTDPTGAPVAGARVAAAVRDDRLLVVRVSDTTGNARFETLSPGTYVVDVDAPGFATAARTIAVRADTPSITISLNVAAVVEHVVVTGAGHLQTASEVSKAVTVVDAGEMAARNEFSVADALRTVPGATVQQLGGPGSFTSVKLRGLREQDTAFLIDGVRFRDAAAPQGDATAFVGELFIAHLDRIEVLRGSGSSLYGSHAIGGAVNLITASGSGRPTAGVSAEAGGLGFSKVTAHTAGGALGDRATFSLGAGHTRTLRGVDGDDEARNTSVQGRGSVLLGASARATVRVYGSNALSSINESPAAIGPLPATGFVQAEPGTFAPGANDPDNVRAGHFVSTLVLFEQRPSSAFGYTVSFHRLGTDRVFRDGPLRVSAFEPVTQTSSRFKATIETLDARADREWSTRQTTRVAYEFERERYVSESLPVNRVLAWNADIIQDSHAASVHHEVRFDALQVAGSLRAQRFALKDVALVPAERAPFAAASFASPPSALTADISATRLFARTGTKLRSHAGNAYRAPAMFERAGVSFGSRGYSIFGDPGIEPERSSSVDAGVDQTLSRGRALVSATAAQDMPRRIVSLAPSVTEVLYEAGAGSRVVGVTSYCLFPREVLALPKVGGYLTPSYEALVALQPDLVVTLAEHADVEPKIRALGIPILRLDHRSLDGIVRSIEQVGERCGTAPRAKQAADALRQTLAGAKRSAGGARPRVLICFGRAEDFRRLTAAAPGTIHDDLITQAGGVNVLASPAIAYPTLSAEGIMRLDPDVIIEFSSGGTDAAALRRQWNRLDSVRAVRNGRVYVFTGEFLSVPGPRFARVAETIARSIRGER